MSFGQNTQCFNAKNFKKTEKEIQVQRKQLEELRLQDESQNTRLLKIQQKERNIDHEYRDRKKKMEDTMEVLGFEAEKFNEEQKRMNQDLESKKEALVLTNDRKKKQEEDRCTREQKQNQLREKEIEEAKVQKIKLEYYNIYIYNQREELLELTVQIDSYRQYENFLKKVLDLSEDFQSDDKAEENGVKQIIERYNTLKFKEKEFKLKADKIEAEKDEVNQEIFQVRKQIEVETLSFNSKYNESKLRIDDLNAQNRRLENEIEGKLNQNNSKQAEFAQIVMAIKNLHFQIKQRQDEESSHTSVPQIQEDIVTKNHVLLEKLSYIKDRLRYLVEIRDNWNLYVREKNLQNPFHNN